MNTPIKDGSLRGMIFAALTALLVFASDKTDFLTDSDVNTLAPVVVFLAFFFAAVYDRYVRPKRQ